MALGSATKAPDQRSHHHVPTIYQNEEDDFEGKGDDDWRQHHHSHGHQNRGHYHVNNEKRDEYEEADLESAADLRNHERWNKDAERQVVRLNIFRVRP